MSFVDGRMYTVKQLSKNHPHWASVQDAVHRRTKPDYKRKYGPLVLQELYEVRWRRKPFPWSYYNEFKPKRRWFFHGTTQQSIIKILDEGFKIGPVRSGRMLGDGIYATYHAHKAESYAPEDYVLSVMIYAPHTLVVHPGQSLDAATIANASKKYHAVEVRTGVKVPGWTMKNHEICVYDVRRIIPRFILKFSSHKSSSA